MASAGLGCTRDDDGLEPERRRPPLPQLDDSRRIERLLEHDDRFSDGRLAAHRADRRVGERDGILAQQDAGGVDREWQCGVRLSRRSRWGRGLARRQRA